MNEGVASDSSQSVSNFARGTPDVAGQRWGCLCVYIYIIGDLVFLSFADTGTMTDIFPWSALFILGFLLVFSY